MLHFHTNVFARPSSAKLGPTVQLRGIEFATYAGPGGGPPVFDLPLPRSFEETQERLLTIPRMDVEPDGYFLVAGGENAGERWQIDGHLFEYEGEMHRIEMHGNCPETTWMEFCTLIAPGGEALVCQLVLEGVTLAEPDFRRWAGRPTD